MEKRDTTIKPYKILIVDDDPLVVKALERLLFKKNYLFYSVNSGEEALETVNDINPDIILLDVYMKGLTGFEVCSQLNKMGITKRIPVIFLTSTNQTSEIVKGFQSGAVDYIIKPFNTEELLARLLTHLELKKAREEIKNINMIKERFFSIMTHDINDALTGVKGVAEFLNQELKQSSVNIDEVKKLSAFLLDDSTELYHFLQNLIKWDYIESDLNPIQIERINARELTDHISRKYIHAINEKNILIHNKVDQNTMLFTNSSMLGDIINELISNAIKYSNIGGIISIDMVKEKNLTIIQIEDQGVGMDKEVVENVFKLDTPHPKTIGTNNEKGIGLGLIICYSLVKKLNGNIKIQSEKHKGSRIIIHLPDLE
jgi:two-component system, sensor histidine kinase and response regulator